MIGLTQVQLSNIERRDWPVIIVGAGPAGAICALQLARTGHEVLVVEQHRFPRHKTCGDQLMFDSLRILKKLNLLNNVRQEAIELNSIRVFSPSQIDFVTPGSYLGIRRHDFDDILMRAAMEAGARFAEGHVTKVQPGPDDSARVTVRGMEQDLKASVCVIATGASVRLADKLGLIQRRRPSAVAIRFYVESSFDLPESILSYDRSLLPGYAWIFPVAKNLFNIGCGLRLTKGTTHPGDLHAILNQFLIEFPIATRIIERRWYSSKPQGAPIRCGLSGCLGYLKENILLTGEVIGTTFPFTGEGIGKAMHSGMIAGEVIGNALTSGDLHLLTQYTDRINDELRPLYYGYRMAEKWLKNPRLTDYFARRVCRSRFLQSELEAFTTETGDPRRLFAWSSLLKSYFK